MLFPGIQGHGLIFTHLVKPGSGNEIERICLTIAVSLKKVVECSRKKRQL